MQNLAINPRPPKQWFDDMMKRLKRDYPKEKGESARYYNKAIAQIAGGIWFNQYSPATRRELIARYDNPTVANPTRSRNVRPPTLGQTQLVSILLLGGLVYLLWRNWPRA